MSSSPLVSIIIAAYNAEEFVAQAIGSVLAQDHRPIEVIVIDDGSTDGTARIAESYGPPVTCIRAEHKGPAAARNRGFEVARGTYWGVLDADDLYLPGKTTLQLAILDQHPEAGMVLGLTEIWGLVNGPREPMEFKPLRRGQAQDIKMDRGLYRRSAFERVGLLDESLQQYEDWDWLARAAEMNIGRVHHDDVVMHVRRHTGNITLDVKSASLYRVIAVKRALDRRRARGESIPDSPHEHGRSHR